MSQREVWKSIMYTMDSSNECAELALARVSRSTTPPGCPARRRCRRTDRRSDAHAHWLATGLAGDRHQAAHALGDLVEAGRWASGPLWPKPEILA